MQAARPKLSSSPCLSPSQRQSHPQHPSSQPTVIKQAARPRPATGSPHMDSRPTRIDPELNRCRPGIALQSAIDLGSTRYRSGLIGIDPGSTHSRRTIRHRPVVIRHRPGGDPRSTVGILTWARPAVDPHSTRCWRSIRDALELDPGSTRGRSELTRGRSESFRDRSEVDPGSTFARWSIRDWFWLDPDRPWSNRVSAATWGRSGSPGAVRDEPGRPVVDPQSAADPRLPRIDRYRSWADRRIETGWIDRQSTRSGIGPESLGGPGSAGDRSGSSEDRPPVVRVDPAPTLH